MVVSGQYFNNEAKLLPLSDRIVRRLVPHDLCGIVVYELLKGIKIMFVLSEWNFVSCF